MFARISSYHGSPNRVKEGSRVITELTPELQQMPGFQRAYLLVDGKSGRAFALSLWRNEEDMSHSTSNTSSARDRIAKAIGESGKPTVEFYEVGVEVAPKLEGAKYARVSEYHGSPQKVEDAIRTAKGTESALKQMQGFQQVYLFVDRKSGKAITISFWDSETALNRSSTGVSPLRDSIAQSIGSSAHPTGEVFEVAGEIPQRIRKAA